MHHAESRRGVQVDVGFSSAGVVNMYGPSTNVFGALVAASDVAVGGNLFVNGARFHVASQPAARAAERRRCARAGAAVAPPPVCAPPGGDRLISPSPGVWQA